MWPLATWDLRKADNDLVIITEGSGSGSFQKSTCPRLHLSSQEKVQLKPRPKIPFVQPHSFNFIKIYRDPRPFTTDFPENSQ